MWDAFRRLLTCASVCVFGIKVWIKEVKKVAILRSKVASKKLRDLKVRIGMLTDL